MLSATLTVNPAGEESATAASAEIGPVSKKTTDERKNRRVIPLILSDLRRARPAPWQVDRCSADLLPDSSPKGHRRGRGSRRRSGQIRRRRTSLPAGRDREECGTGWNHDTQ